MAQSPAFTIRSDWSRGSGDVPSGDSGGRMKPGWTILGLMALAAMNVAAGAAPRARDLGIPFDGTPGPLNAITDVAGVTVGHTTLIRGEGKLEIGQGPVRTGATGVVPTGQ